MNNLVFVVGAGGHGSVVINALIQSGRSVCGITDENPLTHGTKILDIPIIGGDEAILKLNPAEVSLCLGIGIGGGTLPQGLALRLGLYSQFVKAGFKFDKLIHPSAVVCENVNLSSGVQIMAGVVLQTGVCIGENTIVNTRASIDHDCVIGAHSHIAPGTILGGGVIVGEAVHVSIGAVISPNVKIGNNAVIAAGAVVIKDVPSHSTVYGIPAKEKND